MGAKLHGVVAFAVLFLLLGCQSQPPAQARRKGFYFWKTELHLTPPLQQRIQQEGATRLFIKFADIGRNPTTGEIEPLALLLARDTQGIAGQDVVPCFFLTNAVFAQTDAGTTGWLADRLVESLESVGAQLGKKASDWPEIQLDCDWTATTRAAYFRWISQLRQRLPNAQINVTIRLHQYHAPNQTGVPPAHRGTLMCYNTGDIDDINTENSIFDPKDAEKYATSTDYPLPLDLALPLFSWALVFRGGEFWRIVPEPSVETLRDSAYFEQENRLYRVRKATFFGGQYLAPNDQIRVEAVTRQDLDRAQPFLQSLRLAPDATVLWFSL